MFHYVWGPLGPRSWWGLGALESCRARARSPSWSSTPGPALELGTEAQVHLLRSDPVGSSGLGGDGDGNIRRARQ